MRCGFSDLRYMKKVLRRNSGIAQDFRLRAGRPGRPVKFATILPVRGVWPNITH